MMRWTIQRTSRKRSSLLVLPGCAFGPGWLAAVTDASVTDELALAQVTVR